VTTHVIFPWTTSTSASKDASSLTTRPPRISSCWSRPAPAPAPAYTDTSTLRSRVLFQPASYGRVARFPPTKYGRCLSISSSMLTRQSPPTPTVYCTYIQWRNVTMGWLLRLMTGCPTGGRGPPTVLELGLLVVNFSVCLLLLKLKNAYR